MTPPCKILSITDSIVHLSFNTQYQLTSSLLRFQEHYEGEVHRGKVFTLKEFKTWYTKRMGAFTYYSDWAGFNFPGTILKPFIRGEFDKLSAKEEVVLNLLLKHNVTDDHYIIGTFGKKSENTLKHEIAHGLFHTVPEYRKAALKVVRSLPFESYKAIADYLGSIGYHPDVWDDEVHAYLLCDYKYLHQHNVPLDMYHATSNLRLHMEFDKHFGKLKKT